jgi:hypothetical protein
MMLCECHCLRVDVAFRMNDVCPGKFPSCMMHVRSLISRDVLSDLFRTHMLLAFQEPKMKSVCGRRLCRCLLAAASWLCRCLMAAACLRQDVSLPQGRSLFCAAVSLPLGRSRVYKLCRCRVAAACSEKAVSLPLDRSQVAKTVSLPHCRCLS